MVISDEIPEWAKKGPVTLRNYDYRVMWHGQTKKWGDGWPMLKFGASNFPVWHEYFYCHLGGFPWCFQALLDGKIKQMNIPEARPEWFDPSFVPSIGYRIVSKDQEVSPEEDERIRTKFAGLMKSLGKTMTQVVRPAWKRHSDEALRSTYEKRE